MRFKLPNIQVMVLLLSELFVLYLGFNGQLDLYIHPRYELFTLLLVSIGFICTLTYAATSNSHPRTKVNYSFAPLAFVLLAAIVLPANSLSSSTVSQRTADTGSITGVSDQSTANLFSGGSSKSLSLNDWARILSANTNPNYYFNKPAKVSGFVYDAGLGADTFQASRFIVTCCAVDAQPTGIPVYAPNWSSQYDQDDWVEIEGQFRTTETLQGNKLVLIPDTITSIDEPDSPYAN